MTLRSVKCQLNFDARRMSRECGWLPSHDDHHLHLGRDDHHLGGDDHHPGGDHHHLEQTGDSHCHCILADAVWVEICSGQVDTNIYLLCSLHI